ncbi:hypothetical protein MRBLMN1_003155 [Chitinophaga ginsengisegetis]|uniref:hypothetical protein n=1 Tax=Chitinophaga TaxID=79328 RepID=UPI003437ADEE
MIQNEVYYVDYSTDLREIGILPQAKFLYYPNMDSDQIRYSIDLSGIVNGIEVVTRAKWSDFLNVVDCMGHEGFVCSEMCESVLLELNLPPVQSFKTNAFNGADQKNYWINLFDHQFYDFIDYDGSKFVAEGISAGKIVFESSSKPDFEDKVASARKQGHYEISPQMVIIKKELVRDYDLFSFPKLGISLFATHKFYQAYMDLKLTGLQFRKAEVFKFI